MKRTSTGAIAACAACALAGYGIGRARADGVPSSPTMTYSAYLEESGQPVEGQRAMKVRLFDDPAAGNLACEVDAPVVEVKAGRFAVPLMETCTQAVRDEPDLWVELELAGQTLAPRTKLGAVPYAVEASRASEAAGLLEARIAALEKQATNPECPVGYARDANVTTAIVCVKGGDEVVRVGAGGSAFWIDRYEASVWEKADGTGAAYFANVDDFPAAFPKNGQWAGATPPAFAISKSGVLPSRFITWFQAATACRASGKRLPTGEEWLEAARGTVDPVGGSDGAGETCVTQAAGTRFSGLASACVSAWGAEDLVGNQWEWTSDWYASVGNALAALDKLDAWEAQTYADDGTWNIDSWAETSAAIKQGAPAAACRGGSYEGGPASGVFALYLKSAPSDSSAASIGFRCVVAR